MQKRRRSQVGQRNSTRKTKGSGGVKVSHPCLRLEIRLRYVEFLVQTRYQSGFGGTKNLEQFPSRSCNEPEAEEASSVPGRLENALLVCTPHRWLSARRFPRATANRRTRTDIPRT